MNSDRCSYLASSCIGVFVSFIIGAIVGLLYAFGYISVGITVLWIALVLAFILLIFVLSALLLTSLTLDTPLSLCLRSCANVFLFAIFGTILLALVLCLVWPASLIIASILIAIEVFFFSLMLIALAAFIRCILCVIHY